MPPNNGANIQPSWLNKLGQYYYSLYYFLQKPRNVFQRNKSRNPERASGDYPARSRNELLDRAIFAWPWNEKRRLTEYERASWLVHRTDTNALGFWLCQRTIWDNESTDTSLLRHTATQLANRTMPFHIGLSLAEKRRGHVWSFHSLADKTNKENLLKPFFKVIQKSLYMGASFFTKIQIRIFNPKTDNSFLS